MAKDLMIFCIRHLLYFTVKILYNTHAPTQIYTCEFVCINVCIGIWFLYGDIDTRMYVYVCVGECVVHLPFYLPF